MKALTINLNMIESKHKQNQKQNKTFPFRIVTVRQAKPKLLKV